MTETQNAVARHRRELGLSQATLARAAGLSRQALSAVEAGRSVPSTAIALRLARALGRSVEDLFWLAEEREIDVHLPHGNAHRGRARLGYVDGRWIAHPLDPSAIADAADVEIIDLQGT